MPAETVRVTLRFGLGLRFRLRVLQCSCLVASLVVPWRAERIFDWFEERALRMVERGAEVEVV